MKILRISAAILALTVSGSALAHDEPGLKEQVKDDWREIRNAASEAGSTAAEWGKSVGRKAADLGQEAAETAKDLGHKAKIKAGELTEKARQAAHNDKAAAEQEAAEKDEPGSRFFY